MTSMPEYKRGYRDGMRQAATWLSERAKAMNDPHATQVLNSAATNLGLNIDSYVNYAVKKPE